MIRWRYLFASLLVFLTLTSAAKAAEKKKLPQVAPPILPDSGHDPRARCDKRERLRKALSLPCISAEIHYGVNGRGGFENSADLSPDPDKIAAIEKESTSILSVPEPG